jgi:hypothetical protein
MKIPELVQIAAIRFTDFKYQPDLSASSFTFGDGLTLHTAQTILDECESDEEDEEILECFIEELEEVIRVYGPNVLIAL